MKKVLLLALALIAIVPAAVEAQQDLDELVQQGDTYLKRGLFRRNNLTPYTGGVIRYNEGKRVVEVRGSLRNGKWHGRYESFGQFAQSGRYDNGGKCGVWSELQAPDPQLMLRECARLTDEAFVRCMVRISKQGPVNYPAC